MKHFFNLSQTYSEVTPESAEHGDFSDTGYELAQDDYNIKDILQLIRDQGNEELSICGDTLRIYGWYSTQDYQTMTEKQLCLHIKGNARNLNRLKKIIEGV